MRLQAGSETDTFTRLHEYVQHHNSVQTELRHTVRLGSLKTLEVLTHQAMKLMRKARHTPELADSDELPSIYTNRVEVAALAKCGARTVYDHLEKLSAAGMIRKRFRGRQNDFQVWINPWILIGGAAPLPTVVDLLTAQNPGFAQLIRPNLPPKNILESNSNYSKSGVDSVEKLGAVIGKLLPPPNPRSSLHSRNFTLERAADPSLSAPENTVETRRGGARPTSPQPPVPAADKGGDGPATAPGDGTASELRIPRPAVSHSQSLLPEAYRTPRDFATKKLQKLLVTGFWELARQKFWPTERFSDKHTASVLNLLWSDVFGFHTSEFNTDTACYTAYHRRVEQLRKAERWVIKQKWESVMPPLAYFSRAHFAQQKLDKQKGNFHHTEAWLLADEKAARRLDGQRLVERAVQSVVQGKPPRNFPDKDPSRISLYAYWNNRIRQTGDAELIDTFNAGVSLVSVDTPDEPTPTTKTP